MYFSVVIPTYNPRKYLQRLLDSIMRNKCRDEIEIVISDDLSDEDFSDILSQYRNVAIVRNNEHMGAPMMGRQNGMSIAKGKWICFADQDDWFLDDAFDNVKDFIETNNAKNYLVTDFIMEDDEGNQTLQENTQNWTHGKFYEKDFLTSANVNYKSLKYCEDIAFSVTITCTLVENGYERFYFNSPTYVWYQHEDSLSNASKFKEKGYFFKSFPDYINGTLGTYIDRYEVTALDEEVDFFYRFNIISMLMYLYFYFQGMKRKKNFCPSIPTSYYSLTYKYFQRFLKRAGYKSYKEMLEHIDTEQDFIDEFARARSICVKQIPFIEKETFDKWIAKLKWRSK